MLYLVPLLGEGVAVIDEHIPAVHVDCTANAEVPPVVVLDVEQAAGPRGQWPSPWAREWGA